MAAKEWELLNYLKYRQPGRKQNRKTQVHHRNLGHPARFYFPRRVGVIGTRWLLCAAHNQKSQIVCLLQTVAKARQVLQAFQDQAVRRFSYVL